MAHKILGIDLGAYSVKIAELEAGFRQAQLVGLYEKRLVEPREGESVIEQQARTARELIEEENLEPEMVASTMAGEAIIRLLTLPFAERKKIEQVLGFELESHILGELDGLVTDFVISSQKPDETRIIAVAAPHDEVKARIDALARFGCEPRVIGAAALSYAALRGHGFPVESGAPQVIVDIGHRHTLVCIVDGETLLFARAIPRGGEDVTLAIEEAFKMAPEDAERAKHEQAFLLGTGEAAASPAHRKVDQAVRDGVRALVRELRQTLAAYRAGGGAQPHKLLLTGGGARLRGLPEHLEVELGLPAARLELRSDDPFIASGVRLGVGDEGLSTTLPSHALGLALAAAAPVPQVNLRKGDLAYRSDYSYLRGKAAYLAVAVLAVLLFAGVNAVAALRASRKEADALEFQLKKATIELFGEPRMDPKAVSEELKGGPKGGAPPIPTTTAYDVLDEISRHVPTTDKLKLDILELDIKPKKTYLKATAESAQQIDDLVDALGKIDCFEKIEKGKISSVTVRPSGAGIPGDDGSSAKPTEMKEFTLTINTTCP